MTEEMRGFPKGEKYSFFPGEKPGKATAVLISGLIGDPGYEMQFIPRSSNIDNPPYSVPDSVIVSDLGVRRMTRREIYKPA